MPTNQKESTLDYHLFSFTFNKNNVTSNASLKQRLYILLYLFSDINPTTLTDQPMDYDLLDAIIDCPHNLVSENTLSSDLQHALKAVYKSTNYIRKVQMNQSSMNPSRHDSSIVSLDSITSCSILTCNSICIETIQELISDVFTDIDYITTQETVYTQTNLYVPYASN